MTTPVIQLLKKNFPRAHLAVLLGPRAFAVFKNDRRINRKIIYDKTISWKDKLVLVNRLRRGRYDLIVDLRHTPLSIFLGARYHTPIFVRAPKSIRHMKDRHLWTLKSLGLSVDDTLGPSINFSENEQNKVKRMFEQWQIRDGQIVVAVACGARSATKRWKKQGYQQLLERLISAYNARIIMVGDEQDKALAEEIINQTRPKPFNACGQTTLGELSCLLIKCRLLVTNDSAPMHLAWAVHTPVVAIFGPTDYRKYAPGGAHDIVIRKELACAPCEQALCPQGRRRCLESISADEVFAACKKIIDER